MASAAAVALAIKVTADAKGASADLENATGKVSKLGKAGQISGKLRAAGLVGAAAAAIKFTQAAAEDQQAQAKLAATATQVAGATDAQKASLEAWITAQGQATGVTDDELRPALEKLLTATHSVSESQKLAGLAMDISARTGKSLESVTQSLAKAQTGSVTGLSKYGVATKDAAGKARSLADIQADLAKAYTGSAAAAADTAAGKAKIAQVQFGELQEQIGAGLLPVMTKLATVGLAAVQWISQNQTTALLLIGTLGALLAIVKAVSIATEVYTAVTKAWSVATKVMSAVQAAFNIILAANPAVLIGLAIVALIAVIVLLYKRSETARDIINAAFGAIQKAAGAVVDFIRNHWKLLVTILTGPVGAAVLLIATHWERIKSGAGAVIEWVRGKWPILRALITGPFDAARTTIDKIWEKVTGAFDAAKKTLSGTATEVKNTVSGAFDSIGNAVQAVIDKVQSVITKIGELAEKAKSLGGGIIGKLTGAGRVASGSSYNAGLPVPDSFLAPSGRSGTVNVQVNFNGIVGDPNAVARQLQQVLRRANVSRGAVVGT